jgi:hypothetical protein
MSDPPAPAAAVPDPLSTESYYSQLCTNIRTTDEISFKLMGAVPLISGAGMTALFAAEAQLKIPRAAIVLVASFAAVVTLALYRWERRNIDVCSWLIRRAADVETEMTAARFDIDPDRLRVLLDGQGRNLAAPARMEAERELSLPQGALMLQFLGPGDARRFWPWRRFGKTEATNVLYGSAILAWLAVIPVALLTG